MQALSFDRANERRPRRLARIVGAVDWLFVRWAVGYTATGLVVLHVAIGRAG